MRIAGVVVLLAILAPAFNLFITATALPSVLTDIGGLAFYAWATIAYSVTSIVGSAASSAVARRWGSRGGLVIANSLFILGIAACAAAPTMGVLVAGRAVQGVGGGMVTGVVHAMVREVFPAPLWPRMLARISVAWGVAALTGPFVGGVLAQLGLWRAGFWATIPFVAGVAAMAWRLLPTRRRPAARDERVPLGRLLLVCAAVLFLALVANVSGAASRIVLLAATAAAVAGALHLDGRAATRLFPSGMLSLRRPLGRCFWMIFLIAMSASPISIYMALLLQTVHGASPAVAGYVFAGHSIGWTSAAVVTARIPAGGVRAALVGGPLLMAAGLAALFFIMPRGPVAVIAAVIFAEGMGIGLCWAHVSHVVLGSARAGEEEATAALIPSTQLFAIAFGGALSAIIAAAAGLTREVSPAVAAAAGQALFGVFAFGALTAGVIAMRLAPAAPSR